MGFDKTGSCYDSLRKTVSLDGFWKSVDLSPQYVNIIQIWYGPAAACTKSAILLLYLRVFVPHRGSKFDIAIRAFILIICGFYFAITIAKICQCLPRARIWDKTIPGKCVNMSALLGTSGLFNIVSDVCILLVPLKGVWDLQMSPKRKIGIYAIFTVGVMLVLLFNLWPCDL